MKNSTYFILPLITWACAVNVCGAGELLVCPATLSLVSGVVNPENIPPDYLPVISKGVVRLSGDNMFDGHPNNGVALKPSKSSAGYQKNTWVFEGEYPAGKWFSCDYAEGLIRLTRKLQEPVSQCTDTVKKIKPYGTLTIRLNCE